MSPAHLVPGSTAEAHVVGADDGVKIPAAVQSVDVTSDSCSQNELTITSDSSVARPGPTDADRGSALALKSVDQSVVNAGKAADGRSIAEPGASDLSSQESSVTRTRSCDVMDLEHLRMKLVQLTGPNKEATGSNTAAAKTKLETEETSVDGVGVSPSPGLNTATNSASQVNVGRPVNQAELQPAAQRGPSVSPEPISQLTASQCELLSATVTQRDASYQTAAGQTNVVSSNGENAGVPVQPVKPVPVYPVAVAQPLAQQRVIPQMAPAAGVIAPDVQAAMLLQQQQLASAVVDSAGGSFAAQPSLSAEMVGTSCPASPDGMSQMLANQQPTAADYSQASLLALYNQMMMPIPLMASAWPALGLNAFLVAANPLLAAQMMYGASLGQLPAVDAHTGLPGYPVASQEPQHQVVPGLDHSWTDQPVRPTSGLAPMASVPSGGMPPVVAGTRPAAVRLPGAVLGSEQHPASQSTSAQRKQQPQLAILEQALIEKLHGSRKPATSVIASQAVQSAAVVMPDGQHTQPPSRTPTAVSSPVMSPVFTAGLQPPASVSGLPTDLTTSISTGSSVAGMPLPGTATHSGRTTPSLSTAAESVPVTGKSVTAVTLPLTQQPNSELAESVQGTTSCDETLTADSSSSVGQTPSKRKMQFMVSTVKDDPLAVNNLHESAAVCEASVVTSDLPPQDTVTVAQNSAAVSAGSLEPGAASAGKASVKKGRFRITDVVETGVNSGELETSAVTSGTRNELSNNCATAAALMVSAQQVRSAILSSFHLLLQSC